MILLFVVQVVPIISDLLQEPIEEEEQEVPVYPVVTGNPAIFEMYIEYENGNVYTNTLLLEEALKSEENIRAAEAETGVEISDLLEFEAEVEYYKTQSDRGAVGATRNELSNIWIVIARVGSEQENLRVSNYFYDLIINDEIEMLGNKPTYIMSEPRVLTDEELADPNINVDKGAKITNKSTFNLRKIFESLIIAVLGGFVLGFVLILTVTFFQKKILYAFNYNWNEDDLFMLLDENNYQAMERTIRIPNNTKRLVLLQNKEEFSTLNQLDNLLVADNILNVDVSHEVEEVVIFVQPGVTDKKWYNQQKEFAKVYNAPVKIIQSSGL